MISECSADIPASSHNIAANLFVFEGAVNGHRFCTIRNCAARGSTTYDPPPPIATELVRAILPGLGLGTVIEGNQIANCAIGVYYNPQTIDSPAKDVVVWNNVFRNVSMGMYFNNGSIVANPAVGRLILQDNIIEIATVATSLSGGNWRTGLRLNTGQASTRFTQVTIRKNLVRDVQTPTGLTPNLRAFDLQQIGSLIVENNVIGNIAAYDSATAISAINAQNCTSRKFFNNEDPGGTLIRGYIGSQKQLELQDAVDDVLLPI